MKRLGIRQRTALVLALPSRLFDLSALVSSKRRLVFLFKVILIMCAQLHGPCDQYVDGNMLHVTGRDLRALLGPASTSTVQRRKRRAS